MTQSPQLAAAPALAHSSRLEAQFRAHPFLAGLPPEHLSILDAHSMPVRYAAGETIFRQGEPANRFYLLLTGQVSLQSPRAQLPPLNIQTLGRGDALGWSWLFEPYYWEFDAVALQPTIAIFLYGARLRALCEDNHSLGYELMKRTAAVVIQRLQATRQRLTWMIEMV